MDSISSFALLRTGSIPYRSRSVRRIVQGCRVFRRCEPAAATGLKPQPALASVCWSCWGLKRGRVGPRPYDLRHAFAVHRLSRWYRQGVDLHPRLPWLSAYMGHVDIVGTETYLNTTPELLDLAGKRLRSRYAKTKAENDSV